MNEDALYDLSDEELEAEVRKLKETSADDEEKEDEVDDSSTPQENLDEEDNLDEEIEEETESKEEDEEPLDEEDVDEQLEQPSKAEDSKDNNTYEIKANGKVYNMTIEELKRLSSMGMDYTRKTQELAPYRKTISAMRDNGLSDEDINLLIDIKKGKNKQAIKKLLTDTGIDLMELDDFDDETSNQAYTPTDYGKKYEQSGVDTVVSRLSSDPVFQQTAEIVSTFDDTSKQFIMSNPDAIEGLHIDVKEGVFAKVMPEAEKIGALDGYKRPMLEYYIQAGQEFFYKQQALEAQESEKKAKEEQMRKTRKKGASLPSSRQDRKKTITSYDDISDEEYLEWYKNKVANAGM